MRLLAFLAVTLWAVAVQAAPNIFTSDVQMCSGRPWIDVTCNGADPTGSADSTTAISNTISTAVSNDWPIFFPAGTYKVTSKITVEYGGQANNGPQIISQGAAIDGSSITSGNVLQVQCTGGTTASPVVCNHFAIKGWLTVKGSGAGYVTTLGKTDFSDQQNGVRIEHLVVTNAGSGGAIQANYLTDGDLWLSGSTQGGSSSVGAVALEQVQTSKLGGYASALGASAPGLLVENGASVGDSVIGFGYDPNDNTCISITSSAATLNAWLAPYLPCTVAINANAPANNNALIGPTFAGANRGPISDGISVIGRGSLYRYLAPAVSSLTLYGTDDGTMFSSANATGPSTQYTAASLPITLPSPSQVGAGWIAAFVTDNNKAVVLSTPSGSQILARNQRLTSLTVDAAYQAGNFETAVLQSDGSNFRLEYISQGAALVNGLQTGLPWNWGFPAGPAYTVTGADNGSILSSGQTSSGLTVTLPQPSSLPPGWTVGVAQDGSKPVIVNVNGTNGGQIIKPFAGSVSSLTTAYAAQIIMLNFDGSAFRELAPPIANAVDVREFPGALCNGVNADDSPGINAALAAYNTVIIPPSPGCNVGSGSRITINRNQVALIGPGDQFSGQLNFSGTAGISIGFNPTQVMGVALKNLYLHGSGMTGGTMIDSSRTAQFNLTNIYMDGVWNGISWWIANNPSATKVVINGKSGTNIGNQFMMKYAGPTNGTDRSDALTLNNVVTNAFYDGADGFLWDGLAASVSMNTVRILATNHCLRVMNTAESFSYYPTFLESNDLECDGQVSGARIDAGSDFHFLGNNDIDCNNASATSCVPLSVFADGQATYGTATSNSYSLTGLYSLTGINVGQVITGPGIQGGTTVSGFGAGTIIMSQPAISTATGVFSFLGSFTRGVTLSPGMSVHDAPLNALYLEGKAITADGIQAYDTNHNGNGSAPVVIIGDNTDHVKFNSGIIGVKYGDPYVPSYAFQINGNAGGANNYGAAHVSICNVDMTGALLGDITSTTPNFVNYCGQGISYDGNPVGPTVVDFGHGSEKILNITNWGTGGTPTPAGCTPSGGAPPVQTQITAALGVPCAYTTITQTAGASAQSVFSAGLANAGGMVLQPAAGPLILNPSSGKIVLPSSLPLNFSGSCSGNAGVIWKDGSGNLHVC